MLWGGAHFEEIELNSEVETIPIGGTSWACNWRDFRAVDLEAVSMWGSGLMD